MTALATRLRFSRRANRFFRSRPLVVGGLILAFALIVALTAPYFYPGDPRDMVARPSLWPGSDPLFPFGTDMMGRDIASEMAHSARASLLVGIVSTSIALAIGITAGVLAGYFGGFVDEALMRICELFQTMPTLLFTIILVVIISPSVASIATAIGITSWPQIARLVRAEALKIRETDFVRAAVTLGMGDCRIILKHVLPNSLAPVVVMASILIAHAVLTDASLSFLGLGDPSVMSWGTMIGLSRPMLRTAWYMTALPGAAIFLTVMAFMLIGNGLNDIFNPRTK